MKPPCHNRPPTLDEYTRYGIDSQTGEVMSVTLKHWFVDKCATHLGSGIGPNGESYPEAHNWLPYCNTCRWNPNG